MVEEKKKFMSDIDYNKSSESCPQCAEECKKIDRIINLYKKSGIF